MKAIHRRFSMPATMLAATVLVGGNDAAAQTAPPLQVPLPKTAAEVAGPVPGNTMTNAYVQQVGRMAYLWGYPMVNAHNRRAAFAQAPEPGLLGGVVPMAPVGFNQMLTDYIKPEETFIVCPNQDVAYGAGFTALDKEPTVVQVPDFGDRFYVYALYDQRTDEIARIGKQYGTKPGFYMIVGPNWKGKVPKGVTAAVRSSTDLVFVVPRVFKEATPEDTAAVQPVIDQIVMYPLSQFDGKMKTKDYSKCNPNPWSGDCHPYRKRSRLHQTCAGSGIGSEPSVARQDHWCGTDRSPTFERRASEHERQLDHGPLALTVVGRSGVDFYFLALASDTDSHRLSGL